MKCRFKWSRENQTVALATTTNSDLMGFRRAGSRIAGSPASAIAVQTAGRSAASHGRDPAVFGQTDGSRKARVLVVDDSPAIMRIVRARAWRTRRLKSSRPVAVPRQSNVVMQSRPDAIVLAVVLPDGCGLATFERIRQLDPTIPVIFITASNRSVTAIEAMRLGCLITSSNRWTLRSYARRWHAP